MNNGEPNYFAALTAYSESILGHTPTVAVFCMGPEGQRLSSYRVIKREEQFRLRDGLHFASLGPRLG